MAHQSDNSLAFSVLLNLLFEHVRDPSGDVYTDITVATATDMSQSAISALRRGISTNPRFNNVKALCRFFDVPLTYFSAESKSQAIDIILHSKHNDQSGRTGLATRVTYLSDEARDDLERIVNWIQKADLQGKRAKDEDE